MSKYLPLTVHLLDQPTQSVRMSFSEIEAVLGRSLPPSATTHRAWWSNNAQSNVMTRAWLDAGFESEQVDLPGRKLVFRRVPGKAAASGFAEAPQPKLSSGKPGLFGWMRGTVTIAPGPVLTDPSDPEWGAATDA